MNHFDGQQVLPAIRKPKDLEQLLQSPYRWLVLLDSHVSQLIGIAGLARKAGKQLLVHVDLIHGLKNDEHAIEFLSQTVRPAGMISTRSSAVATAKKLKMIAIQRHFLLDSTAVESSCRMSEKIRPDYIELMPGVMPHIIAEIRERVAVPILAGGLIRTSAEVEQALSAGAVAVTTSQKEIWERYAQGS